MANLEEAKKALATAGALQRELDEMGAGRPMKCGGCPKVEYRGRTYIWCPELLTWRLPEDRCPSKRED